MPFPRRLRSPAVPDKMPGVYWAYGFWALTCVPLLPVVPLSAIRDVQRIAELAALPAAPRIAHAGAVFAGRLDGPTTTTAGGHVAVAWVGTVTVERRAGKSSHTYEKCRLGQIDHLTLIGDDGRRLAILGPGLPALKVPEDLEALRDGSPTYELGQDFQTEPVPPAIVERCGLTSTELARDTWSYQESWAAPGARVEVAGCPALGGDAVAACPVGPAVGQLAAHGIHALARRMADRTLGMAALIALILTMFSAIGGVSALLELRRKAGGGRCGR